MPSLPRPDEVVVRTRGLRREFGATIALDGVDVEVRSGITGLVGPNGAGKTTLIGVLLGLDHADGGEVTVLGLDPTTHGAQVRTRLGYAPEYDPMPPDVRAQDLVRLMAELHGLDASTALGRATDVLQRLGLGEERFRPVGSLSTGQKQRVKLAQAIVHDPKLVLLDEPTDGLDPLQRQDMLRLIRSLADDLQLDVLVSSHVLADLERICDRVVVMRDGRVVAERELRGDHSTGLVEVVTDADAASLVARLRGAGRSVEVIDDRRLVVPDDEPTLDLLRDLLAELGSGLVSLSPRTRSLEHVVLEEVAG